MHTRLGELPKGYRTSEGLLTTLGSTLMIPCSRLCPPLDLLHHSSCLGAC